MSATLRAGTWAVALTSVVLFSSVSFSYADTVANNLDVTVDSTVEDSTLNIGNTTDVTFRLIADNTDGDSQCNLDGSGESVTFSVNSSDTNKATVNPGTITFQGGSGGGCNATQTVTVTAVGAGIANFTLSLGTNTSGSTAWEVAPAAFKVTVSAPVVKTDPTLAVDNSP